MNINLFQIEEFIDHIQPSVVNNQIFPNVAQGFMDTNPTIRDHTIKVSMVFLCVFKCLCLDIDSLKV